MKTLLSLVTLILLGEPVPGPAGEAKKPLQVCLISGSAEYRSDESLARLQQILEKEHGMVCTRAFARSDSDLPGLDNLDTCDVAILFTRRLKLEGKQLDQLKRYCLAGKPLIALRTASHAVQTWLDLDHDVLGGNYKGHYAEGPTAEIALVEAARAHPILKGVKPFSSPGSLYKNTGLAKDVDVLLTGTIPDHSEPVAWTRSHAGGRVFYTSLGHPDDFRDPNFVRLVVNALTWTTKR